MRNKTISRSEQSTPSISNHFLNTYLAGAFDGTTSSSDRAQTINGLLADVIHQVRTPITGILGMLDVLLDSHLTELQREATLTAQAGAEDLLALFNNALDLPMMEAGILPLRRSTFDLHHALQSTLTQAAVHARLRNVQIDIQCDTLMQCIDVSGDAERLQQALSNLIAYVVRFSADQIITITGSRTDTREEGVALNLRIAVISPLLSKRLATHASVGHDQPWPNASARFSAAELALLVCQHLMKIMGGQLEIECLPEGRVQIDMKLAFALAHNPLDGIRVLLADSDPTHQTTIKNALFAHQVRVDCVSDASAALAALTATTTDDDIYRIAILDQQLSGVDGETLGCAISADHKHSDTQLILMGQGDLHRLQKDGFAAVVGSSSNTSVLLETMTKLCMMACNGHPSLFIADGAEISSGADDRPYENRRILVVDDDMVSQRVASHMLEELGCIVNFANDGKYAAAMHAENAYDLILMDCEMPGMDGYQATAEIRSAERLAVRTPIIAWSARVTPEESHKSLTGGFDDFMPKPMRKQILRDMLATWLAASDQNDHEGESSPPDELEEIQQIFGDGFGELVALFRADSPKRIHALHIAVAEHDMMQIAKIAHALSGSTASIGASRLSTLCKQLEKNAREGELHEPDVRLRALEQEYASVESRLQAILEKRGN